MYRITYSEDLAPNIHLIKVLAPAAARKALEGQFVMLMVDEKGERIPLTIAGYDRQEGTVTVIFMELGKTTRKLAGLDVGDSVFSFLGPLGVPTHIEKFGTVVCVGGGFGVATTAPIARAMKNAGNTVISIMGFRNKDLMFWEDELRKVSDELYIMTDDGSYGDKGVVTIPLQRMLEEGRRIDLVVAIGPAIMMKFVSKTTEPFKVPTVVSLNPVLVDGTGLCGGCRVSIGGETKFACVDGPDFDAHLVDWDLLMSRQRVYLDEEKQSLKLWEEEAHPC
ncbi:MAG: sulfide/dihydroorotate dehydrogenase-like FAD/NAD-binding protein, partial [Dehalococcoidia bacterium]|nr:sulfide/dihydroorotate dehydrogenase-like FAD/NAD-binding protein [Dehalococcoidia bacterium]